MHISWLPCVLHACPITYFFESMNLVKAVFGRDYKSWSSSLSNFFFLFPLRHKYSLRRPVLEYPWSVFFPKAGENISGSLYKQICRYLRLGVGNVGPAVVATSALLLLCRCECYVLIPQRVLGN
jgi:hypothetical protein